jgi:hypothetical protein
MCFKVACRCAHRGSARPHEGWATADAAPQEQSCAQGEHGLSIGGSFKLVLPTAPAVAAVAPAAGQWREYLW